MSSNLRNIYIYTFLYSFLLLNPIWVLYLLNLGYDLFLVTVLDVVFFLTIVLASIPMGKVTDRIGRKNALLISSLLSGTGIILFGLLTSFVGIALSYALWGIGAAVNSSALESISFEYSVAHNLRYLRVFGIVNFTSSLSVALASIIGGIVGGISGLRMVVIVTGVIVIISSGYTIRLKDERGSYHHERQRNKLRDYIKDRKVMSLILLRIAFVLNFNILLIFKQPYYKELGIITAIIGFIFFADVILRGLSSLLTQKLSFIVRNRFFSMLFFTSLTFFTIYIPGLIVNEFSIIFLVLNSAIYGFYTNILSEEVNVQVPSEIRATVLSVVLLVSAMLSAFSEPFLGYAATVVGLNDTLIIFSFIFLSVATAAILLYSIREPDKKKSMKTQIGPA